MFPGGSTLSSKLAATKIKIHHTTTWRFMIRELKLFPYKLQMLQKISDTDKVKRISFSQYYRNELGNDSRILKQVLFSDECKFSISGQVNKQSCRTWGLERPQEVCKGPHNSPSIIVWFVLSQAEVTAPYFSKTKKLEDRVTKDLRYYVLPRLWSYPGEMILQQNGAFSHCAVMMRQ